MATAARSASWVACGVLCSKGERSRSCFSVVSRGFGRRPALWPSAFLCVVAAICVDSGLAHIHVAPEYFQSCDSGVPPRKLQPTGAALLLSQFGSSAEAFCSGPWAELLGCLENQGDGEGPLSAENPELLSSLIEVERAALAAESAILALDSPARSLEDGLSPRGLSASDWISSDRKHEERKTDPATIHSKTHAAREASSARRKDHRASLESPHDDGKPTRKKLPTDPPSSEEALPLLGDWGSLFPFLPKTLSQFVAAVGSSCTVVGATELGDRTFFLAALLASRYSRAIVFAAAAGALILASFASTALGALLQAAENADSSGSQGFWARVLEVGAQYNIVGWTAALLLLAFGFVELVKAWKAFRRNQASPASARERGLLQGSADISTAEFSPLEVRPPSPSLHFHGRQVSSGSSPHVPCRGFCERMSEASETELSSYPRSEASSSESNIEPAQLDSAWMDSMAEREQRSKRLEEALDRAGSEDRRDEWGGGEDGEVGEALAEAQEDLNRLRTRKIRLLTLRASLQYSRLGLHPSVLRVFREVFALTLFAELGDKSMLATVSLAASRNPWGVLLGSCLAHVFVTLSAVFCGKLLRNWLSDRGLKLFAGLLMFGFGALAAVEAATSMKA